jgi:hypothetical protein
MKGRRSLQPPILLPANSSLKASKLQQDYQAAWNELLSWFQLECSRYLYASEIRARDTCLGEVRRAKQKLQKLNFG